MIGVFDSGYGGLTILKGLVAVLPQYSYIYLGDNARAPYGDRSAQEIAKFTTEGVEYLFSLGCELVILGCNTASANALRSIQQDVLPKKYPDKKVLGILVPTIEQITGVSWKSDKKLESVDRQPTMTVGVLATQQTVASKSYEHEIHKRSNTIIVIQQACPDLVPLIERGASEAELTGKIQEYLDLLYGKITDVPLRAVLLGCTHYALIADLVARLLPSNVHLYEQPNIVAISLAEYLQRHPEIERKINREGSRTFLTTGFVEAVQAHSKRFYGEEIEFRNTQM